MVRVDCWNISLMRHRSCLEIIIKVAITSYFIYLDIFRMKHGNLGIYMCQVRASIILSARKNILLDFRLDWTLHMPDIKCVLFGSFHDLKETQWLEREFRVKVFDEKAWNRFNSFRSQFLLAYLQLSNLISETIPGKLHWIHWIYEIYMLSWVLYNKTSEIYLTTQE